MLQDLLNNIWVFNRSDDSNGSTALFTFLNFNGENTLETLRPGHRIGLRFRVLWFFVRFLRNNVFTQFAVWREHSMKPGQVDSRLGYQRRQLLFRVLERLQNQPYVSSSKTRRTAPLDQPTLSNPSFFPETTLKSIVQGLRCSGKRRLLSDLHRPQHPT